MRALFVKPQRSAWRRWFWALIILLPTAMALLSMVQNQAFFSDNFGVHDWLTDRKNNTITEQVPLSFAPTALPLPPAPAATTPLSPPVALEAPSPADPPAPISQEQVIAEFLNEWAANWSAKNIEAYFAAYSKHFKPESNKTLRDWALERRQKILGKSRISVRVVDPIILSADQQVLTVRFTQIYESDRLQSTSSKILVLNLSEENWKIQREYTP